MKYKNILVISMLVLSMIAAVVWAVDMATVTITVNNPQFNNTNMSANFNDTFNVSFSSTANISNATFIFHRGGTHLTGTRLCNFTIYNTTLDDVTSLRNSSINASVGTLTACTDGYYNVSIQAFNFTVNGNAFASLNNSIINMTIDRVAPQASFAGPNVSTEPANLSDGILAFNVSLVDATLGVYLGYLDVGGSFAGGTFNATFNDTQGGTNWWVVNINTSLFTEDDYDTITITTNDTEGNSNLTEELAIRVDRTVPYTVYLNTTSYNTTDTTFNITVTGMDNIYKNVTCRLQVNNQSYNVSNIVNGTESGLTVNTAFNNNNTWAVSTNCTDGSGNVNTTFNTPYNATSNTWINVTVDTVAPQVGINTNTTNISAFNVSTSATSVNLSAILSDAILGVYIVRFNVTNLTSGVLQFNTSASVSGGELGAWNVTVDPTLLGEGELTVRAVANDTNNNQNNSETLILRVDRTIPNTVMNSTRFNTTDTTPNVTFSIKDNVYLNVSCTLYQNNQSDNTTRFNNASIANLTINSSLGQTNTLFLYVNCTDGSSNRNTTSSVLDGINVTIDSVSPRVGFNSNTTVVNAINVSTTATFVNISVAVSDAILGVYAVRLNVTNASATLQYNATLLSGSGGQESSWNASINVTDLGEGEHTATAVTNDTNNNANNSETLIVRIDRTVPNTVMNTSSFNTTDTTPNVTFSIKDNVYLNVSCTLYQNNQSDNTTRFVNSSIANLTINSSLGQTNTVFMYVNCTDGSSNVNTTSSILDGINVTIDSIAPLIDFIGPNVTSENTFNVTNSSTTVNLNITSADAILGVYAVRFNISNASTGVDGRFYVAAVTGSGGNRSAWNASVNLTDLPDGEHRVTVFGNDTNANLNSTRVLLARVDRTRPYIVRINTTTHNTSDSTPNITVTFKDAVYKNATCNLFANNVSYNASNIVNGTATELVVNATGLADGSYFFSLNCTDGSSNRNSTDSNESAGVNITIDTAVPLVSAFNVPTVTFQRADFLVNVTVNESGNIRDARYVQYRLENGSNAGQILTNYTNGNLSLNGSASEYWSVLVGIDVLVDGNYTLRINATDWLGNSNTTQTLTVSLDNSAPTISSFTCKDIGTGDAQSCTCTAADNSGSFGGGVTTVIGTTDTGASGTKTVGCTATDTAGNTRSDTTTFTVSSAGGSSGGSGGGSSSGVRDQFEKKVWTSINAGETASMIVENGVIGVSEVSFTVSDTARGAWVQVRKATTMPSSVADFAAKAYSTIEMTQLNVADKVQGDVTVKFKVDKAWLTSNEVKKNEVALFRHVDGAWVKLGTTVGEDDGTYVHYTAKTPGFSYFVIGQTTSSPSAVAEEAGAEEEVPPAVTGGEVAPPAVEEVAAEEAPVEEPADSGNLLWVVPVLAVIVLAVVLYWYWKRR